MSGSTHSGGGSQSTQAPIGRVTAWLLLPSQGGMTAPKPPAGPPAATTRSWSGDSMRGIDAVAAVAHNRALADLGPFAAMDAGALVDERGDVALAPTRRLQVLAQLLGDDQRIVAGMDRVVAQVGAHLGGEGLEDLLRLRRPLVHDLARRPGRHHGHRRRLPGRPRCSRQRRPCRVLLVLGDAVAELAGMAERGAVDRARPHVHAG